MTAVVRSIVKFPARVVTDGVINVSVSNGTYTFSIDQTALAALIPSLSGTTTKGQLMAAVSKDLPNGVAGFETWLPAAADNLFRLAYEHATDASSLSGALLAYMQASSSANPPGLGMTVSASNNTLSTLLSDAVLQPR